MKKEQIINNFKECRLLCIKFLELNGFSEDKFEGIIDIDEEGITFSYNAAGCGCCYDTEFEIITWKEIEEDEKF